MKYVKLFESFDSVNEKDVKNMSIKKAKRPEKEVSEADDDDISAEDQDYQDRLEKLSDKLVPPSGTADTIEGEMVRAISRVGYRYFNDGDFFFRGYGKETVLPSVKWLKSESPLSTEMKSIFAEAQRNAPKSERQYRNGQSYMDYPDQFSEKNDGYLKAMRKAIKAVVDYVESKNGEYTKNDGHDSR